jgi:hypothetical protein
MTAPRCSQTDKVPLPAATVTAPLDTSTVLLVIGQIAAHVTSLLLSRMNHLGANSNTRLFCRGKLGPQQCPAYEPPEQ